MNYFSKVIICNNICNNKDNRQRRPVEEGVARPHTSPCTSPFKILPPALPIIFTIQSSNSSTRAPRAAEERQRQRRFEDRRAVEVTVAVRHCRNRAITSVFAPNAASASWARAADARPWVECTTWRVLRALTAAAIFRASRSMPSTGSPFVRQTTSRRLRSAASVSGPFSTGY